jgi:hypothetical protein
MQIKQWRTSKNKDVRAVCWHMLSQLDLNVFLLCSGTGRIACPTHYENFNYNLFDEFFLCRVCLCCTEVNRWSVHIADIASTLYPIEFQFAMPLSPPTNMFFFVPAANNMWMHPTWRIVVLCKNLISAFQNVCERQGCWGRRKILRNYLPSADSGTTRRHE